MNPLRSYSKPLALTHKHAEVLRVHGPHLVYQEKIDGSQFSFGLVDGVLRFRSRRVEVFEAGAGMFDKAVACVKAVEGLLNEGWTYRGEYLRAPKHNTCAYDRVPKNHIILFDIDMGHCDYLTPDEAATEAIRLDFEYGRTWDSPGPFDPAWLKEPSALGGPCVEGVVVKDYASIGADGKVSMAKVVREDFKEVHALEWKRKHPTKGDIVATIIEAYRTEARWEKSVQHLEEAGELLNAPQDIGRLFKEVAADVEAECVDEIKELLWQANRKAILRGVGRGLPDWYKARLNERADP